jgi:thiol-disulfide isomerase/thioredoxin
MPRIHACAGFALAALLYGIAASPVHAAPPPALSALRAYPVPRALPPVTVAGERGSAWSFRALRGHVVVLNLWATWCAPCVEELPALARLAQAEGTRRFAVIAVNEGHDDAAATAAFLKAHGAANLAVYRDPDLALLGAFGAQGLPFSIVVDAKGREIGRASGPMHWDDPTALAWFGKLAAGGAP